MRRTPPSKSLSKKGLYAPLSAYKNDTSSDSAKSKAPSSLRDSALIEFLVKVGQQRNRQGSLTGGKNNGGRPASQNEIDECIRQRALTLVGGGINASISVPRDRQRISTLQVSKSSHSARRRKFQACDVAKEASSSHNTWKTLQKTNQIWVGYVHKCLRDDGMNSKPFDESALKAVFATLVTSVELVGAFVSIERCNSQRNLVSTRGYLVGETAATWKIAVLPRQKKQKPKERFCISVSVPKEGTSVSVYLPFGHTTTNAPVLSHDGHKGY